MVCADCLIQDVRVNAFVQKVSTLQMEEEIALVMEAPQQLTVMLETDVTAP